METPTITISDKEEVPLNLHVVLNPDVYAKYLLQSINSSRPLSGLLSSRLAQYVDSTSEKPLIFDDTSRQKLERILRRNFSTPEELIKFMESFNSVEIGGMKTQLYPKLLERLQSRALNQPLDKFVSQVITRALEEFVGLR